MPATWFAFFFFQLIVAQRPPAEPAPSLPWYYSAGSQHFPQLFATDLQDRTFASTLANSTDEYVLIDFYAPWCPHCQHFAPDYERLSLAIRQLDENATRDAKASKAGDLRATAATNATILSATLDCVRYARTCEFWGVDSFPTLLWGRRTDWLQRNLSKLESIDVDRTADNVAFWINNRTNASLNPSLVSKAEMNRLLLQHRPSTKSTDLAAGANAAHGNVLGEAANAWDVQLALALWLRQIFDHHAFQRYPRDEHQSNHNESSEPISGDPHKALFDLVDVLAVRFPEVSNGGSCRKSLVALQDRLRHNITSVVEALTPELVKFNADRLESLWRLCDTDWAAYSSGWQSCRGTWPGKRGFTCGLWNLFHVLAARSDDSSALSDLQTVRTAVLYFFDCEECRNHFQQIPIPDGDHLSRSEAQLWWWAAHNYVNERVKRLEEQYDDGDPGFPKVQWPTQSQCPSCRSTGQPSASKRTLRLRGPATSALSISSASIKVGKPRLDWNVSEVSAFLDRFYGKPRLASEL
mmetsp:Transcript_8349/g.14055  ORF Transcript_8349/g.14055 Transcript_8349/m.14055 type:complete len:524 (+) Transcript_8349:64-1635(+)